MKLNDELVEAIVDKYIKDKDVISFGTSKASEQLIKRIAIKIEEKNEKVCVVPSSLRMASIASELGLEIVTLDEKEVDVAIEFADYVDEQFNFVKMDASSLIKDKMIGQSAAELIVICEHDKFEKRLKVIPFEVASFGWKRTEIQLGALGKAKLRKHNSKVFRTETGNYFIDVELDDIYSLDDIDYATKEIPGVIETGLFIGYADRILLHNGKEITVKSRLDYSKQ